MLVELAKPVWLIFLNGDNMNEAFTITHFFDELENKKIIGNKCTECGKLHLPARPICDQCKSQSVELFEFSENATLEAFSVVYITTSKFLAAGYGRENPNCVGIVKMEDGPKISTELYGFDLTHPEKIQIR